MQNQNLPYFSSPEIGSITEAQIEFQKLCPKIPKDSKGQRGKYADLSTILDIVKPILVQCGLNLTQLPDGEFGLITILAHKSGEFIGASYRMQPNPETIDSKTGEKAITPQRIGSVITYMRRYAIGAVLNLNIDVDDDAELPKEPDTPKPTSKDLIAAKTAAMQKQAESTSTAGNSAAAATSATTTTTTKLMNEGGGPTSENENQPCGEQLAKRIKDALVHAEQQKPGITKEFKAKLFASGREKITDFTVAEAKQVLVSIQNKEIVSFFENQLKPKQQTAA